MKDHEHPHACPWCGRAQDAALGVSDDAPPSPGACSMCIDCGRWGIFTATGLRRATPAELAEINRNPNAVAVHNAWEASR